MKYNKIIPGLIILISLVACKKQTEYFIDGEGTHDPHVNVTTYDYLKQNPLFDTLVQLIDRAGVKDAVNSQNSTFFACTDYSIVNWLNAVRGRILNTYGQDSAIKFNLNSLNYAQVKDSLLQYIIPARAEREGLKLTDTEFSTMLTGDKKIAYLQETTAYTSEATPTRPRYLYYVKVYGNRDPKTGTPPPVAQQDIEVRCQTTGILTTNGVLHVLENGHLFGFNK